MARIGFYHLQRSPLDAALPRLLERVLALGHRVVVLAGSADRVRHLDTVLWTQDPASWLPHGTARDGDAPLHPIWLTEHDENPNSADVLVLVDGMDAAALDGYRRICDLFDGNDPQAVQAARRRWSRWKAAGHELIYYQQDERGGWVEKASTRRE